MSEDRLRRILELIAELFGDTAQPAQDCASQMMEIREAVTMNLDALSEDGVDIHG